MYPHRIRLRGPWEYEVPGQPAGRLHLPTTLAEAGLAGVSGQVRFRRRFGYPGRIDADERVWLLLEQVPVPAIITLNDRQPGESVWAGDQAFDITQQLRPRNELTIDLDVTGLDTLWREAALEVRCLAYLQGVRVEITQGIVRVAGKVTGPAVEPLDLYLVAERSTAAYRVIVPSPTGEPFELATSAVDAGGQPVRWVKIELVHGARVWYTMEIDLFAQAAG